MFKDDFMNYALTKSKIITGLQCHKRLWFDVNNPIKTQSHLFYLGNRFGELARSIYGEGLNLGGQFNAALVVKRTKDAIANPSVKVIYEAAFLHSDTLVRADVLRRVDEYWELIEIKSSTEVKNVHIEDAGIQTLIMQESGLPLSKIKIGHINSNFVYQGDLNYDGLIVEVDCTDAVLEQTGQAREWIKELLPYAIKGSPAPNVHMGDWCDKPYVCQYKERCTDLFSVRVGVPIEIIPRIGKKLANEWNAKDIYDLRHLPRDALKNVVHQQIQEAHINNKTWLSLELLHKVRSYGWPRYFMDFETVQQGVPLISGTKPYQAIPFQWSVHVWNSPDEVLKLEDGKSFLEFLGPNMFHNFLESLISVLGKEGPIFVHNKPTERGVLEYLAAREDCQDLVEQIAPIIARLEDTLELVRGGFYDPAMGLDVRGSLYSIKNIVKAIPTSVNYKEEGSEVGSGTDAQIAWYVCTDPKTTEQEKKRWEKSLIEYCAKDTLAVVDLLKHLDSWGNAV